MENSEKLVEKNCLVWRQQAEPVVKAHNLMVSCILLNFQISTLLICSKLHCGKSCVSYMASTRSVVAFVASINNAIMARILGCTHASQLWEHIHDHFQKHVSVHVRQRRPEMRAMTLDDHIVEDYLLHIKLLAT